MIPGLGFGSLSRKDEEEEDVVGFQRSTESPQTQPLPESEDVVMGEKETEEDSTEIKSLALPEFEPTPKDSKEYGERVEKFSSIRQSGYREFQKKTQVGWMAARDKYLKAIKVAGFLIGKGNNFFFLLMFLELRDIQEINENVTEKSFFTLLKKLTNAFQKYAESCCFLGLHQEGVFFCTKSLSFFDSYPELEKNIGSLYGALARISRFQGEYNEASEYINKALKLNPSSNILSKEKAAIENFEAGNEGNESSSNFQPPKKEDTWLKDFKHIIEYKDADFHLKKEFSFTYKLNPEEKDLIDQDVEVCVITNDHDELLDFVKEVGGELTDVKIKIMYKEHIVPLEVMICDAFGLKELQIFLGETEYRVKTID